MPKEYPDWLVLKSKPKSQISEAYRFLRANIEFSVTDKHVSTMLVTSAVPQESITSNIINLALAMVETGKKVIIVDSNLRAPLIHKAFDGDNKPGLTNVLVNHKTLSEVVKKAEDLHSNLRYIPSGPIPPNPSELLVSEKMKTVIRELREQANMIMFTSPPVIGFSDSIVLANQVDSVALIINAGEISQEMAKQAKGLLEKVKTKMLGVILNNVEIKNENFYHYYKFYNYGKYYDS